MWLGSSGGEIERLSSGLSQFGIVGDPPLEAWNRVRRYASWMRQIRLDEWWALGEDTFPKLRLNSPPGGWFPAS